LHYFSSSLNIIDNSDEQRVWSSNYGDSDGSFSNKGMGKHWLCLENGMTYENPNPHPRLKVTRTIGFAFRVKKSILSHANFRSLSSSDIEQMLS